MVSISEKIVRKVSRGRTPCERRGIKKTWIEVREIYLCEYLYKNSQVLVVSSWKDVKKRLMAKTTSIELQHSPGDEIENLCLELVRAFVLSLTQHSPAQFDTALQHLFDWIEAHNEDAYAWHTALSTLRRGLPGLLSVDSSADLGFADTLIDRARLVVAEIAQRQATDVLLRHMETSNRLGLMTSQLLAALDVSDSTSILEQHLPKLGIQQALVAFYSARDDDPLSQCTILLGVNLSDSRTGYQFLTREFPPPGLYHPDQAVQLVILPLVIDEHTTGFVALSANNLELCAAIVHNLAAAFCKRSC